MTNTSKNSPEVRVHRGKGFAVYHGDCFSVLNSVQDGTVDCVITDPPYFLSNDGITCRSGSMVSVNKGEWDRTGGLDQMRGFNREWLGETYRVLKPGGTVWVSGTFHNIFMIGSLVQEQGDFRVLNAVTWVKPSPPPNLSCRYFTHSTETLLWFRKGQSSRHLFNYRDMKEQNGGKQMKDVWTVGRPKKSEKRHGKHPTQKPEELVERMLLSSTRPGDCVLDPFQGSGTTGVLCVRHGRGYIGIEQNSDYVDLALKRLEDETK